MLLYLYCIVKKSILLTTVVVLLIVYASFVPDKNNHVAIPANPQRNGDSATGYNYLVTGDYIKSGIPYQVFAIGNKKDTLNYLNRTGLNKDIPYDFTVITASNGEVLVAPNCLQCHAEVFDGKLIMGLGNNTADFSNSTSTGGNFKQLYDFLRMTGGKKFEASKSFLNASKTITPYMQTYVRGVNVADRIAALLAAHRNPIDFVWSDTPLLEINEQVVPTDVPAWWLLKKKNAMFYNGFGRGDFTKFLMASNLLTVKDTAEAREVYNHFNHVLTFIYSLQPPAYPRTINKQLAANGKKIFVKNCSGCHGTYGEGAQYPNLLIPASVIGTDSALYNSNYSSPQFVEWFNKSWFTKGSNPAILVPFKGYIAPPLDGVWVTAPYLHNGSVPTLDALLNSTTRPTYWTRNFNNKEFDYELNGWSYTTADKPEKGFYNTTIAGYGNYGHYFGDKLNDNERKSVIEYLKSL